jgi:hypothetical protein
MQRVPPVDVAPPSGSRAIEPAAAAQSGRWQGPTLLQEAAEIRASGLFLPPLIPEGGFLVRAVGTLERRADLGVWAIRMRDRINGAPNRLITLLPSGSLADMVDAAQAADAAGETALFEVTGRIMSWRGANYLLVSFAVPVTSLEAPRTSSGPLVPPGASKPATEVATSAAPVPGAGLRPAADPATVAAEPGDVAPLADPENVAAQLERALDSKVTSVARSADAQPAAPLSEPGTAQPSRSAPSSESALAGAIRDPSPSEPLGPDGLPLPRASAGAGGDASGEASGRIDREIGIYDALGTLLPSSGESGRLMPPQRLLDRRGTVTRDPVTGAWVFVLASGGLNEGDIAMELLPCSALDRLISMTRSAPQTMSVVLTGEVTAFAGRNYLRPTRMRSLREGRWIGP